jgi:superkiller protein 3
MSGTKAALKAINAAIQSQDYEEAAQQARALLKADPKSYQG